MKLSLSFMAAILFLVIVFDRTQAESWNQLAHRADSLAKISELDSAIVVAERAVMIAESVRGVSDTAVASILISIGNYHMKNAAFQKADSTFKLALTIREKQYDPTHPAMAVAMMCLGEAKSLSGEIEDAEQLLEKAISIFEACGDDCNSDLAKALKKLADTYGKKYKYKEARPLYNRALTILENLEGDYDIQITKLWISLARLDLIASRYRSAEQLLEKVLAVIPENNRIDSLMVAEVYYKLGIAEKGLGEYAQSETYYRGAATIWEKIMGPENETTAFALFGLGNLYLYQGKYTKSEPLLRKVLSIWQRDLGPTHHYVGGCLRSLASLHRAQGNFAEAESLYSEALTIREKSLGPDHPDIAKVLNKLANLYRDQQKYAEAESLLKRALAINEKAYEHNHGSIATNLNGLALIYRAQGRYDEALELFNRVLEIVEERSGRNHPNVAACLLNMAYIYVRRAQFDRAGPLYQRVLAIHEQSLGWKHPLLATSLEANSAYLFLTGDYRKSLENAEQAFNIRRENFTANARVLSEMDAILFSKLMRGSANSCLSVILGTGLEDTLALRVAGDVILATKGEVSDEMFTRRRSLVTTTDSTLRETVDTYHKARSDLSKLFVKGAEQIDPEKHGRYFARLNSLVDSLETELARRSASFRRSLGISNVTLSKVTSLLPEQTVLVEYMKYDRRDFPTDSLKSHYLVAVFDQNGILALKDLGSTEPIDSVVSLYQKHFQNVTASWPAIGSDILDEADQLQGYLYKTVFYPIESNLRNRKMILLAPDAALNLVSFGGLKDSDGKYLIEQYLLHYLSTGRDLLRLQHRDDKGRGLLAIGNPDYNATVEQRLVALAEDYVPPNDVELNREIARVLRSGCESLQEIIVEPLPYTQREVRKLSKRWKSEMGESSVVLLGTAASEENFKRQSPNKRALHLATHGFFNPGTCDNDSTASNKPDAETAPAGNPLLLSGLFLAGANLHGVGADAPDAEDGILTADEVAALNLDGTQWVVLSACRTGLGWIKAGEGVYGLRRAFQLAGARTVISSLWSVPDKETSRIMEQLYSSFQLNLAEAAREMALKQIARLRKQNLPDHPYSWGAFIAVGDWLFDN